MAILGILGVRPLLMPPERCPAPLLFQHRLASPDVVDLSPHGGREFISLTDERSTPQMSAVQRRAAMTTATCPSSGNLRQLAA